jgi:aminoglycoside phosphotransferase (APT) family kinase protein
VSENRIDRAGAVRPGEELDVERLGAYLAEQFSDLTGNVEVAQFPSGYSNLTYLLAAKLRQGGMRELVLRRPPFGSMVRSAHDMGREHRILSGLAPVYPQAPRPLVYCGDEAVLGAPFYLMERLEGIILRGSLSESERPEPAVMAEVAEAFVATLSELHAVDPAAAGLADLGRPEGYVRRQVEGWSQRWVAARTDETPDMEAVASWLAEHQPTESGAALIHNDFKYDNLVLDARDLSRVVGVLDWEMATVGDPLMDLGGSLGYWMEPEDPPELLGLGLSPTMLAGNPGRLEVAERYAALSGRELGNLVFYFAFGLFKIAVIIQQIYYRYRQGLTKDPRFAQLGSGVRACAMMARQATERGRIDRLFDL